MGGVGAWISEAQRLGAFFLFSLLAPLRFGAFNVSFRHGEESAREIRKPLHRCRVDSVVSTLLTEHPPETPRRIERALAKCRRPAESEQPLPFERVPAFRLDVLGGAVEGQIEPIRTRKPDRRLRELLAKPEQDDRFAARAAA